MHCYRKPKLADHDCEEKRDTKSNNDVILNVSINFKITVYRVGEDRCILKGVRGMCPDTLLRTHEGDIYKSTDIST